MSPAQKKRAKELFPEFYSQRKRLLKQQSKNVFRLAKLKLEGPENEKDLMTQYLAESGRLDVGPLENILHPEIEAQNAATQQLRFQRGLLSPFRIFGNETVAAGNVAAAQVREQEQMAFAQRAYGSGTSNYRAQMGFHEGFPPTGTVDQNQGDATWWRVLQSASNVPQ